MYCLKFARADLNYQFGMDRFILCRGKTHESSVKHFLKKM